MANELGRPGPSLLMPLLPPLLLLLPSGMSLVVNIATAACYHQ